MPLVIGEIKPIDRNTLIDCLHDKSVSCAHVQGKKMKIFTNIKYVEDNIKRGDHIYIAERSYGHMYIWNP